MKISLNPPCNLEKSMVLIKRGRPELKNKVNNVYKKSGIEALSKDLVGFTTCPRFFYFQPFSYQSFSKTDWVPFTLSENRSSENPRSRPLFHTLSTLDAITSQVALSKAGILESNTRGSDVN